MSKTHLEQLVLALTHERESRPLLNGVKGLLPPAGVGIVEPVNRRIVEPVDR
jgi:hypothetical protein